MSTIRVAAAEAILLWRPRPKSPYRSQGKPEGGREAEADDLANSRLTDATRHPEDAVGCVVTREGFVRSGLARPKGHRQRLGVAMGREGISMGAIDLGGSRSEILSRLRAKLAAGRPIVGGGAGTGISAKCEEAGGIDLIVIYNSGRYRMAGRGSLAGLMPYGNANQVVLEMAREVLTAVKKTPVLAGVCATDPFLIRDLFLEDLKRLGFAGIQNFPTVGLIDGTFRANLEETGMGFGHEIDCVAAAHRLELLTSPYVFDVDQAREMTRAGADIIVAHMGLTTSGTIGARTALTLDDCVPRVGEILEAARSVRSDVIVLCHGGPIAMPEDAQFMLDSLPELDGFYGASSMERLPTEIALTAQVERFTGLRRASGHQP